MPRWFWIIVATGFALSGGASVATYADDNGATSRPAGVSSQDADIYAIKTLLAQVTNAAIAKNGFNRLTQYLQIQPATTEATDNAGGGYFRNFDDINDAIDLLRRDWKYKYDGDFSINADNQGVIYNETFRISLEKFGEGAQTAGDHVKADGSADQPRPQGTAAVSVEPNREMQGVSLRLTTAAPPATWKIALPSSATEQSIHDALLKQLNILHDDRSNWPADKTSACRLVSDRVMTALAEAGGK